MNSTRSPENDNRHESSFSLQIETNKQWLLLILKNTPYDHFERYVKNIFLRIYWEWNVSIKK